MCNTSFIYGFLTAVIIMLMYRMWSGEGFADKKEKAEAILSWFSSGGSAYADYKKDLPGSDVVEYNAAKKMYKGGNLNEKTIMNVIA